MIIPLGKFLKTKSLYIADEFKKVDLILLIIFNICFQYFLEHSFSF